MRAPLIAVAAVFLLCCGDSDNGGTPDSGVKKDTGTGCEEDSDCENPYPACLDGRCVQCRANAFCPRNTPYCRPDNICAECLTNDECPLSQVCTGIGICQDCPVCTPPTGYCGVVNGRAGCVACTEDRHCNIDPFHYCDTAVNLCFECLDDSHCADQGLRCLANNTGRSCG